MAFAAIQRCQTYSILLDDTYFGIIIEYLHIKSIFAKIVLLSQYHFNFVNHNKNKKIIARLISNQIGSIFEQSESFKRYYINKTTNPYQLVPKFYTNYGYIQQIAFIQYSQKMMDYYSKWIEVENDKQIDYENVEIEYNSDEDDAYYNIFDEQYNAIKYEGIPFDFVTLCKLQKSELIIYWLKYVMNQTIVSKDIQNIFLNTDGLSSYHWYYKQSFVGICSINNYVKTGGGCSFFLLLLRNICNLPSKEFSIVIKFIIQNSSIISIADLLCISLRVFCRVNNLQIGCDNYGIYLNEFIKHRSFKRQKSNIINQINGPPKWNLYRIVLSIVFNDNQTPIESPQIVSKPIANKYYNEMFGKIGCILRKYVNETELTNYLRSLKDTEIPTKYDIEADEYHKLFLKLLGFT